MPTLNWIGKEAVVKHHKDVPFRLLEPVAELSCGVDEAIARVTQRVRQGGHDVPEATIRRRFDAGYRHFANLYAAEVGAWALYDNSGAQPVLLDWSARP
jgi:hypothetical protein